MGTEQNIIWNKIGYINGLIRHCGKEVFMSRRRVQFWPSARLINYACVAVMNQQNYLDCSLPAKKSEGEGWRRTKVNKKRRGVILTLYTSI